ncbi:MAG: ribosome-associated translation inhibitor RaiA [Gammaproteobacteria bacterium]|nr:ribosome-associated translation inhibitor RaiA [Gammaproteobacteria bacterium]
MSIIPINVTFRGFPHSQSLEDCIREHAGRLNRFSRDVIGIQVLVEASCQHQDGGRIYHARLRFTVPDGEFTISREPGEHRSHEDVYLAIRGVFDAAQRRLKTYVRRRRGQVKLHALRPAAACPRISLTSASVSCGKS